MWQYNKTSEFIKCCEKLEISQEILDAIESWAVSVGRVQTNKQKNYFRSPKNIFEIWVARIPDPDSNKGTSGGFRLIYFFNLNEKSIYVDCIERRQNLGSKTERPKDQQKFTNYLEELKNYLLKELDNG